LAGRTGIAQPTIAKIETGNEIPRVDTLDRLLRECGEAIDVVPIAGVGIDRTGIRTLLSLTPAERIATLRDEAATLDRVAVARRRR
jgi:transcriptional regulator with XRE-family HTH domain